MAYIIIALSIGILTTLVFTHKHIIRMIAEKRALPKIDKILFADIQKSKTQVLSDVHNLTNHRLNDETAMDYFYKIKGLQVMSITEPINFWIKAYLTTPTKVKLNYFEQVKFYETFLNYPSIKKPNKNTDNTLGLNKLESIIATPAIRNLAPQKLAQ